MIRDYENPLVSLNKALLNPYFWGGSVRGDCLISHHSSDSIHFGCIDGSLGGGPLRFPWHRLKQEEERLMLKGAQERIRAEARERREQLREAQRLQVRELKRRREMAGGGAHHFRKWAAKNSVFFGIG